MRTLAELFLLVAERHQDQCLLWKQEGSFQPVSAATLTDRVRRLAKTLMDLGVTPGDRVAIMADNGPHWPAVDFAALSLGAVTVPIYPTLTPDQAAYIARDSGARVAFVHKPQQLEGLLEHRVELPALEYLVLIEGDAPPPTLGWDQALDRGDGYDRDRLDTAARQVSPEQLASLIYTSGTTGQPKGVMLSHDNIVSNVIAALDRLRFQADAVALSFLPLSHSFERTIDYCYFYRGTTIAYAESIQTVPQNLLEVRPHVFVSVPRVYEKFYNRIQEQLAKASPLKRRLFDWALAVGREGLPIRLRGEYPSGLLGLKTALASGLVWSSVRARLGGRFEFAFSGGAPLGRELAEFFWCLGLEIYEGYGLTETSPVATANCPGAVRLGTVGQAIPEVEVRTAADGEVLVRGPNVMQGYFGLEQETREVKDGDGWFHTGDIGELDADGFLSITDRKKEILVNAYGKNVAPAPLESALKASKWINQAVVIGDRRKFLSALLVPDFDTLGPWAQGQGLDPGDRPTLLADPRVRELYAREVERVNEGGARYEQVHVWELLPQEMTQETGELTPTQKIKRRVIHERYGEIIERMYRTADASE
jgi:long-chain acyl-CoA synthetase